jgi:hypothetical protein
VLCGLWGRNTNPFLTVGFPSLFLVVWHQVRSSSTRGDSFSASATACFRHSKSTSKDLYQRNNKKKAGSTAAQDDY